MTQDQITIAFLAGLSLFLAIGIAVEVKQRREAFRLAEDAAERLTKIRETLTLQGESYEEVRNYNTRSLQRCKQLREENDNLKEERNKLQRELTLAESAITGHVSDNELLSERYKALSEEHAAVVEHKCRLEEEAKGLRRDAREAVSELQRARIAGQQSIADTRYSHEGEMDRIRDRLVELVKSQCQHRGILFGEGCARITDPWHALEWLEFAAKDS